MAPSRRAPKSRAKRSTTSLFQPPSPTIHTRSSGGPVDSEPDRNSGSKRIQRKVRSHSKSGAKDESEDQGEADDGDYNNQEEEDEEDVKQRNIRKASKPSRKKPVSQDNVGDDNVGVDSVGGDNVGGDNVGGDNVGGDNIGDGKLPKSKEKFKDNYTWTCITDPDGIAEIEESQGQEVDPNAPSAVGSKGKAKGQAKAKGQGKKDKKVDPNAPPFVDRSPLDTIEKMIRNLVKRCLKDPDFIEFSDSGKLLRIATMCSGSECPIIALELIEESECSWKLNFKDYIS